MKVDVGELIDSGKWSTRQKLLVAGTALAIILDGVDNQLLGNAIPALMSDWSLPRGAFKTVLAMSPLGMMIGGAIGGFLGDRIGRRNALLASVSSFAIMTAAICTATGLNELGWLRFLAGLGLGGAMPSAAALASEFVPLRRRPFAVTLTIVCVPLGGMLAAFISARVIPAYGWRTLFLAGGAITMLLAVFLFLILPESPRYLAMRPKRWPQLVNLLQKLGHPVPADSTFGEAGGAGIETSRGKIGDLFVPGLRRDTIGLFGSFFFCLLVNYIGFLLLVPALSGVGFTQPAASNVLGWWNYGGVGGALAGAWLIHRFGSRFSMLQLSMLAIVSAFAMALMRIAPDQSLKLILMSIVLGGSLNAVQTMMYALAAHVYPTRIRGTGIGAAVAVGRIGNVLAAFVGDFALHKGGLPGYFSTFALGMMVTFIFLLVVCNHIERNLRHG